MAALLGGGKTEGDFPAERLVRKGDSREKVRGIVPEKATGEGGGGSEGAEHCCRVAASLDSFQYAGLLVVRRSLS